MRRIVLSLLTLAVFLPAVAFARIAYLCAIDGQSRSKCCCPAKKQNPDAIPVSAMSKTSCCTLSSVTPAKTVALEPSRAAIDPPPPPVAILAAAPVVQTVARAIVVRPRAQAPPEPAREPLYTSHCALLL